MILRHFTIRAFFTAILIAGGVSGVISQPDGINAAAQQEIDAAGALVDKGDKDSFVQAIARVDHALTLLGENGNKLQLSDAYFLRASAKMAVGRNAVDDLQTFIKLSVDNPTNLFLGNGLMAIQYVTAENDSAAKPYVEQVWELLKDGSYEKIDRSAAGSVIGLHIIRIAGQTLLRLNDGSKALALFGRSIEIADKVSDEEAVEALEEYGLAQQSVGNYQAALQPLQAALTRATAAKLRPQEAEIADNIGSLYLYWLDQVDKAGPYLYRSLKIAEELKSDQLLFEALSDNAQYEYRNINFALALSQYERALKLADKASASDGDQAKVLWGIAQIQMGLGDEARSDATLEQALEKAKTGKQPYIEGSVLVDQTLRRIVKEHGNVDQAWVTDRINRATGLVKDLPGGQKTIGEWLQNWGMWMLTSASVDQAIPILQKGLAHSREWGFRQQEGWALMNMAMAQNIQSDYRGALENLNSALVIFRSLGAHALEARVFEHLMWTWNKLGNPSLAIFFGKSAINVYQGFRKETAELNADQRNGLMSRFEGAYRGLAEILIEQGRLAEAERVLTMLKQEEVMQYVRRDDTVAKHMLETLSVSDDERAAITRYNQLAEKITAAGQEFGDLDTERKQLGVGEFPKQARYDELKQQLADATTAFQKFLEELKLKFGQNDSRVVQVDSSLMSTLRAMKADRVAIVSTIVGEDSLNIIVTTSRTQRAHTVAVGAKRVNELVAKFRDGLTSSAYDPRPASQQLYDLLVKPIEADLSGIKADTIVWSLDGTLRYMPPAALWDKDRGYLVERFANVVINLASRDKIKDRPDKSNKLSVLGVGVSKSVDGFAPLASVPDELDCIVDDKGTGILSAKPECKSGVLTGRKLLDEKFTLANFEGDLGRYPIVHVATHFKLTPGDDKNSFIVLGGGEDRRFTVDRLRSEQSLADVELIVLSACNTATPGGAKANGIEIEGFGSVAQEEGAKAVMASLWPVADTSTKDLMVEFYRLYGKEGKSKAEAIRAAQLKLLRGNYPNGSLSVSRGVPFWSAGSSSLPAYTSDPKAPFAHPFYWSPFILIGNWQ